MDAKRIGYGINRRPRDFFAARLDEVFLDGPKTDRSEFHQMVRFALRRGDTLVVLQISDLGAGKGLRNLRAALEGRGVTVEVFQPIEDKRPPGRPPAADLSDDEWARLGRLHHDVTIDGAYVVTQACKAMGLDPEDPKARHRVRSRMQRRFKARGSHNQEG